MRRILDTFQIGDGAGDYGPIQPKGGYGRDRVPDGAGARAMLFKLNGNAKNTSGGNDNFTVADLKAILGIVFANLTGWFGVDAQMTHDDSLPLDQLRRLCRVTTGRDVMVKSGSSYVELSTLADATVIEALANNASSAFEVIIPRPFELRRLDPKDRDKRTPGTTALRQYGAKVTRAAGFTSTSKIGGSFEQNGNITVKLGFDPIEKRTDDWPEPVQAFKVETAGDVQRFPGGHLLYLGELSAAAASTQLDNVTIRAGEEEVVKNADAATLHGEFAYTAPEGYESLHADETPLFLPPDGARMEDLPAGPSFEFEQVGGASVNPAETVAIIVPELGAKYMQNVAQNVADDSIPDGEKDVRAPKLVNANTYADPTIPQVVAASSGVAIIRKDHRDYTQTIGEKVYDSRTLVQDVPAVITAQIKNIVAAQDGKKAKEAAGNAGAERIAKFLPSRARVQRRGSLAGAASVVKRSTLGID